MAYLLKPNKGSVRKKKRLGAGSGSGLGKTCGKGHKGQRARSGQKRPYMGFEGGQMPLYRRVPKRGFFHQGVEYELFNLSQLNQLDEGTTVSPDFLFEKGWIKKASLNVKVLGNGEITKKINVEVHKISKSAKEKIEKAGGSVKLIEGK